MQMMHPIQQVDQQVCKNTLQNFQETQKSSSVWAQ